MEPAISLKRLLVLVAIAIAMGILGSLIQTILPFLGWRIPTASAQEIQTHDQHFQTGTVEEVVEQRSLSDLEFPAFVQLIKVLPDGGQESLIIPVGDEFQPLTANQLLRTNQQVILSQQPTFDGQTTTVVSDVYRLPMLLMLTLGFFVLVFAVGKWRGLLSILGMMASLGVLFLYILPQLVQGANPLVIAVTGSFLIAGLTLYLSHGFKTTTHLAFGSILITLAAVILLSLTSVKATHLVGLGTEEAYFLQFGSTAQINLQGLLLAGIILGALGVLDDIIVAQISVVNQLYQTNKKIKFDELFNRALEVGKDHVASLVNTLVLAYAGANLPLFLLFYQSDVPLWVSVNNELIAEEIVRTLVGSFGLVLAVPITTLIAAYFIIRYQVVETGGHHHG
jgi:uncharacterized membrane protein